SPIMVASLTDPSIMLIQLSSVTLVKLDGNIVRRDRQSQFVSSYIVDKPHLILSFYKITKAGECYAGAFPMSRTWACGLRHRGGRIHRRKFYESPDPDPHIQSARRLFLRPRRYLSDPRLGIRNPKS